MGLPERAEYTGQIIPGELPIAPEIGAVAPPFELTTTAGDKVNLSTLRGSPILVNFWATWCEPCRVELPGMELVYRDYQAKGLHILAVNLGESSDTAKSWADEFGLTFDLLLDRNQQIAALYQLRGQPSTYVISPEGIITQIFYGPASQDGLQAAIAPFFPNG
jgi:peroxiredoxin